MRKRKFNTADLYVGIIAKQSKTIIDNDGVHHWRYTNCDFGIFIKLNEKSFLRLTTNSIYEVGNHRTAFKVVINPTSLLPFAHVYSLYARTCPTFTLTQISKLEQRVNNELLKNGQIKKLENFLDETKKI